MGPEIIKLLTVCGPNCLANLFPNVIDGNSTNLYMRNANSNETVRPTDINVNAAGVGLVASENTELKTLATRIATGKWMRYKL